jgi:hypothetical protein
LNIEDFVKEALLAIVRGIKAAQADPNSADMIGRLPLGPITGVSVQFDSDNNLVSLVEFDLATTVDNLASGKASIAIFGSGVGVEGKSQPTAVNRITFAVPVGIPAPPAQVEEKRRGDAGALDLVSPRR